MHAFVSDVRRPDSGSLCDRYAPATSSDILGNASSVEALRAWCSSRKGKDVGKTCVLLAGPAGVGTTTAARLCLMEAGYEVLESHAGCMRTGQEMRHQLLLLKLVTHSVLGNKPKALLLDEVDVLMKSEPGAGEELLKHLDSKTGRWVAPVVCTCRQYGYSKMVDLTKRADVMDFGGVSEDELMGLATRVRRENGIQLSDAKQVGLVRGVRGDVRQLLLGLQMVHEGSCRSSQVDPQIDVNRAVDRLMRSREPCGVDEGLRMFDTDVSIVSLMTHENYLDVAGSKKCSLEDVARCADSISASGVVEEHMYSKQAWELSSAYGIFSTVYPSYLCCHVPSGRSCKTAMRFGTLWSKTSNMFTKKKRIRRLQACVSGVCGDTSLDMLCTLRGVAFDLIQRQDWQALKRFSVHYSLDGKDAKDNKTGKKNSYPDLYMLLKCAPVLGEKRGAAYRSTQHAVVAKTLTKAPE